MSVMNKRVYLILVIVMILVLIMNSDTIIKFISAKVVEQKVTAFLENQLQDGDIIFQTSKSAQSKAIQLATGSEFSHMGIVYKNNEELFVYEAVQPVKLTPLKDWIERGENAQFVVRRLRDNRLLTPANLNRMKEVGQRFLGKDYDIYFGWSDERIYCSELVWKIYKEALGIEIGQLQTLQDFDLTHETVKEKMRERYGDQIPLLEKVISPASMIQSELLFTVAGNY